MTNTIIQWNCRGIKANHEELLLLLKKYNLKTVCLQETFLKDINHLQIKKFSVISLHTQRWTKSFWRCLYLCKERHQININSGLQVIAVKATLHKPINICSIYLPPHDPLHNQKLDKLIEQIPKPYISLGDFNSLSTIWGVPKKQQKGNRFGKVYQWQ